MPKKNDKTDLEKAKQELLKRAMPGDSDNSIINKTDSKKTITNSGLNAGKKASLENNKISGLSAGSTGTGGGNNDEPPRDNDDLSLNSEDKENTNFAEDNLDISNRFQKGQLMPINITEEMKRDYIDYSMSVIVSRALPDVRDGLKPSQRRILVVLRDLALWPKSKHRKSAKIAGDTTGNYHPHSESNVYPAMVRLAQKFKTRYPLVDGQGNFGSINGDPPAQMRYTEARMTKITQEMLRDLDKGTVLFVENYEGTRNEPTVLPAGVPLLLINGVDGIAVGMATKMPPHNLREVLEACLAMIEKGNHSEKKCIYNDLRLRREKKETIPFTLNSQPFDYLESYINPKREDYKEIYEVITQTLAGNVVAYSTLFAKSIVEDQAKKISLYPSFSSEVTIDDLLEHIQGPDLPTGGSIYNRKEVSSMYETGRGRVQMRGTVTVEENKEGKMEVVITDIPYQVNRSVLLQNIAALVNQGKIKGVSDVIDESKRAVIKLKNSANPHVVVNKLFKYTALQLNFNSNMIALVNNEPQTLNLKRLLELFVEHRMVVVIRRLEFELAQARYRGHIVSGLLKALDFIDEIIKLIRASKTQDEAKINLIERFQFTDVQAQAILDMQLRRLAALEKQKLEDESSTLKLLIDNHNNILVDTAKILALIAEELTDIKDNYSDKRRTKVYKGKVGELADEDLIANEQTFVTVSKSGYIKRLSPTLYREQKRGGKGSRGVKTKADDYMNHAFICDTHDAIMLFTNKGRVFQIKAHEVPEAGKQARGIPVVNIVPINQNETITAILTVPKSGQISSVGDITISDEDQLQEKQSPTKGVKHLVMATKMGIIKRTNVQNFSKIRQTGLIAITLNVGDELIQVRPATGEQEVILVTQNGKSIRFPEEQITLTGRSSKGVKGIALKKDDIVINMDIIRQNEDRLFVISSKGYGKFTLLKKFRQQHRAGRGIFAFRVTDKTGYLVAARVFDHPDVQLILVSRRGLVIRSALDAIPVLNRQTSGVRIMKMNTGDEVIGMAAV